MNHDDHGQSVSLAQVIMAEVKATPATAATSTPSAASTTTEVKELPASLATTFVVNNNLACGQACVLWTFK
jgi:hypothetical protein